LLKNIYNGFLNFVLPNSCISCQSIITGDEKYLCPECNNKLEPYNDTHPWRSERISDGTIDNSLSAFWFREGTPIQPLLHAMKYGKTRGVGVMLGKKLGDKIESTQRETFSYIIPVPLHKAKYRDRTFNQSEFIAKGVSQIINTPIMKDGISRTRFTGTQTKLNKPERKENVSGAFEVNPKHTESIRGKNVILIDDVITTGATILECASVLKKVGAGKVWICSAAYAELKINVI
jgi:ComF family protein